MEMKMKKKRCRCLLCFAWVTWTSSSIEGMYTIRSLPLFSIKSNNQRNWGPWKEKKDRKKHNNLIKQPKTASSTVSSHPKSAAKQGHKAGWVLEHLYVSHPNDYRRIVKRRRRNHIASIETPARPVDTVTPDDHIVFGELLRSTWRTREVGWRDVRVRRSTIGTRVPRCAFLNDSVRSLGIGFEVSSCSADRSMSGFRGCRRNRDERGSG